MERAGFPASKKQVEDAANTLRRQRDPEATPLSKFWYTEFRQDHPQLRHTFLKAIEKSRKSFEASGIADVVTFFKDLEELVKTHRLGPSETWNKDKAGLRLACLRETIEVLIVRTTRIIRPEILDPANRKSCTLLGAGNTVGDTIPPWLIFKTFPSESFAGITADNKMHFVKSDTAFSNIEISFDWLYNFNRVSWMKSVQAIKLGVTLNAWFGCNEWLRVDGVEQVKVPSPPTYHSDDKKI